ncbi:MAG: hypothetical protein H7Z74_18775, partial [Anaerolineae bacterium]|nr:hypothetical protein [Gemmatimonadaceae bacterium]
LAASTNRGGKVGDAQCYLLDAGGLLHFALQAMSRIASDPQAAHALLELEQLQG